MFCNIPESRQCTDPFPDQFNHYIVVATWDNTGKITTVIRLDF